MSETPDQTLPEPGHPGRPDQGLPGRPGDRPEVDPHPGRGPGGPKPDNTLPEPPKPTPKK